MQRLGKLLYIVERNRKISAAVASQPTQRSSGNSQRASQKALRPDRVSANSARAATIGPRDPNVDIVTQRPMLRASGQAVSRGFPPPYPSRYSPQGSRVGPQGGQKQAVSKGANALQRVCLATSLDLPSLIFCMLLSVSGGLLARESPG